MPVSSARPDSGDSSYATRMLLNIFDSLLTLRERLQYRHICHVLISSHWRHRWLAKLAAVLSVRGKASYFHLRPVMRQVARDVCSRLLPMTRMTLMVDDQNLDRFGPRK